MDLMYFSMNHRERCHAEQNLYAVIQKKHASLFLWISLHPRQHFPLQQSIKKELHPIFTAQYIVLVKRTSEHKAGRVLLLQHTRLHAELSMFVPVKAVTHYFLSQLALVRLLLALL